MKPGRRVFHKTFTTILIAMFENALENCRHFLSFKRLLELFACLCISISIFPETFCSCAFSGCNLKFGIDVVKRNNVDSVL